MRAAAFHFDSTWDEFGEQVQFAIHRIMTAPDPVSGKPVETISASDANCLLNALVRANVYDGDMVSTLTKSVIASISAVSNNDFLPGLRSQLELTQSLPKEYLDSLNDRFSSFTTMQKIFAAWCCSSLPDMTVARELLLRFGTEDTIPAKGAPLRYLSQALIASKMHRYNNDGIDFRSAVKEFQTQELSFKKTKNTPSGFEKEFLRACHNAGFYPETEVRIGGFRFDFVFLSRDNKRLAVELNGEPFHHLRNVQLNGGGYRKPTFVKDVVKGLVAKNLHHDLQILPNHEWIQAFGKADFVRDFLNRHGINSCPQTKKIT